MFRRLRRVVLTVRCFRVLGLSGNFRASNFPRVLEDDGSKDSRGINNVKSFGRLRKVERVRKDTSAWRGLSDSLNFKGFDGTDRFRRVRIAQRTGRFSDFRRCRSPASFGSLMKRADYRFLGRAGGL